MNMRTLTSDGCCWRPNPSRNLRISSACSADYSSGITCAHGTLFGEKKYHSVRFANEVRCSITISEFGVWCAIHFESVIYFTSLHKDRPSIIQIWREDTRGQPVQPPPSMSSWCNDSQRVLQMEMNGHCPTDLKVADPLIRKDLSTTGATKM